MANSFEKYEIKGYEVNDNFEVMFTKWIMTPEIFESIETTEKAATSAKSSDYGVISKAIKSYPHVPILREALFAYHVNRDEHEKAEEVNNEMLYDYPNFLSGYINKAFQYLDEGEYEKMAEILTPNFDLKDLFPSRDVFYIQEFLKMQYVAILYFSAIGELDKGWDRFRIMDEVAPSDSLTGFASHHLTKVDFGAYDFDEDDFDDYSEDYDEGFEDDEMENYIGPDVADQLITTETEMPAFNHGLVRDLYIYFFDELPDGLITEISELPRESLIEDLETMINDSFERFTYLTEDDIEVDSSFVAHAIFMLAEINAVEKAPLIYKVLSQSYEYLDWFLDVIFEHDLFDPFYKLLAGEPEKMVEFIKKPGIGNMARIVVLSLIKEIALQDPTQKLIAINYHEQLLDFFIDAKPEDNVFDNMIVDGVVAHLLLLGAEQTLPKIKYVQDEGMLFNFADMPFENMKDVLQNPRPTEKLQLLSMEEAYEQIDFDEFDEVDEYDDEFGGDFDDFPDVFERPKGMSEEKFDEVMEKVRKTMEEGGSLGDLTNGAGMTVVKSPKPGRNEPCFCGSGKKYKKCCLGKNE